MHSCFCSRLLQGDSGKMASNANWKQRDDEPQQSTTQNDASLSSSDRFFCLLENPQRFCRHCDGGKWRYGLHGVRLCVSLVVVVYIYMYISSISAILGNCLYMSLALYVRCVCEVNYRRGNMPVFLRSLFVSVMASFSSDISYCSQAFSYVGPQFKGQRVS